MTDYIEAYREYRQEKTKVSMNGKLAPYDWVPSNASGPREIIYITLLDEHHRELSNSINHLARSICKLEAWSMVIKDKDDKEKLNLVIEFIDDIATITLNLPYVIRSRFIVSITKLSHQANLIKLKNFNDELPLDKFIYMEHFDMYTASWKCFRKLKPALEKINNKAYQGETGDFRSKYNHRYSPKIEVGISELIKRDKDIEGNVIYSFNKTPPLKLENIITALKKQHEYCLKVYELYQNLIAEQLESFDKR
ncbi:TPA: hypothetical protein PXN62_003413 [Yersinia enterocolitica]|nr:hypothetical protein [Yersinia enterocolitica]